MDGHEKEIVSLLRKIEIGNGCKVLVVKRRPSSMPHVRELRNLEWLVSYCNSNKKKRKKKKRSWSSGWGMVCK